MTPLKNDSFSESILTQHEIVYQFRHAMFESGICYLGDIVGDGKLHRFHVEGHRPFTANGAYVLHLDGLPAGWFMDYKSGIMQTWRFTDGPSIPISVCKHMDEAKKQRAEETRLRQEEAAKKANYIWENKTRSVVNHAYLTRKRIKPYGARVYGDALTIPLYGEDAESIINLQFITPEGDKRFLSGGKKKGCFFIIGGLTHKILICEGFATGASLYKHTRQRVIVSFDCGNLLHVARNTRKLAPDSEIILCGDHDKSGVGQGSAEIAAAAVRGKVLIPPTPGMDWNDYLGEVENV